MTFTPDMPFSGQSLGNSRTQVLNNFKNYYDVVSRNHVAPNASGQGKHTFVQMPVQSPVPSTLAGEGGLFTQSLSSDPTKSILYYQRDANTTINQPVLPMAMATFILRNSNEAATVVNGYNVTAVTRIGVGAYRVNLAITLPYVAGTTEYGVLLSERGQPTNQGTVFYTQVDLVTPQNIFFIQLTNTQGTPVDDTGNRFTFSVLQ